MSSNADCRQAPAGDQASAVSSVRMIVQLEVAIQRALLSLAVTRDGDDGTKSSMPLAGN